MARKGGDFAKVAESAYDASATFGVFMAFVKAIGGTIFAIGIVAIGIWLLRMKDPYEGRASGKVTAAKCETKDGATRCTIDYEFGVGDKKYTMSGYKIDGTYVVGSSVKVHYDTANPDNHKVEPMSWKFLGWIAIAFGILLGIGVWVWFYIARTFKVAAAATGVGTVVDFANGSST